MNLYDSEINKSNQTSCGQGISYSDLSGTQQTTAAAPPEDDTREKGACAKLIPMDMNSINYKKRIGFFY